MKTYAQIIQARNPVEDLTAAIERETRDGFERAEDQMHGWDMQVLERYREKAEAAVASGKPYPHPEDAFYAPQLEPVPAHLSLENRTKIEARNRHAEDRAWKSAKIEASRIACAIVLGEFDVDD